ncbi:Uncharacterised protein [Dermatophilus congolensis]|uniref:Polymerase beta nucleotidyltransferase domain-containing protein n=2 Tax=Dermatophilus congolensis TaxID=1863 RepID=A0AA46H1I1_9MICO|nr:Uncharacterised protein [Dermatophilus congolensis]
MATVTQTMRQLQNPQLTSTLRDLCIQHEIALLMLHGTCVTSTTDAPRLDLAYLPTHQNIDHLRVVTAFLAILPTERLDVIALNWDDPIAAHTAFENGRPLYENEPNLFTTLRHQAAIDYAHSHWLHDFTLPTRTPYWEA